MKTNLVETAVGAVVILIAAAFFTFAYTTSGIGRGSGGTTLTAEFDNAAGINVGSDVRMSGVKIGAVVGQSLNTENFQAVVILSVDPALQLPDDSTVKITSEGLLGSNFIAIEPGGSETKLKSGDRLMFTQGAVDIWSLVSQYMFSGDKEKEGEKPAQSEAPATESTPPAEQPQQPQQ